jgi:hypothetical protein
MRCARAPGSGSGNRLLLERGVRAPRVVHVVLGSGQRDPARQARIRAGGGQLHFQFASFTGRGGPRPAPVRPGVANEARLLACEAEVVRVASRRRPTERVHGVAELPELLPHADIVVLTLRESPATVGLMDAEPGTAP